MALSYRAAPAFTNSGSTGVTSISVTKQAGTASGDWVFIYVFGGTASMACSGFTAALDTSGFGGLLYRRADGTEGASFSVTGLAGNRVSAMIVTVAGAAAALDPATIGTLTSGGAATSIAVSGITLAGAGDWCLWFAANQNGFSGPGYAITPPSGFTSQGTSGALASNATIMLADNQAISPGATGTKTGTFTSASYYSGVMLGVTPSAAGGGTAAVTGAAAATGAARQAAGAAAAGAGQVTAAASVTNPVITFPGTGGNPLGVKAELLLGGVWTDITAYVAVRNPVQISGAGRADWTSTLQAATLTLTLRNDGRFTPKLAAGAYYPNITRNTQIRVGVTSTGATGIAYSGYRFFGEVAEWPPRWDVSGRDVYADITANGIWRRMSQLQTTLGSAYTRYNAITLTGGNAPRCYWPMEDGAGSGSLVPYDSVAGTANATQSWITGTGTGLSLAACTDFKGSDGIPQLNAALITATVPAGGTPTNNCTRFLLSVPAAGDSASGTVNWDLAEINSAGTVARFEVLLMVAGTLRMYLRNSGGTVLATGDTTTNVRGQPYLVSCELTPSGGNVAFALRLIKPGAAGITESMTGTLTTASVGQVSSVRFSRGYTLMDTAVGHLSITYGAVPSMVSAASALGGYTGEKALDRFTRICAEMGITAETIGTAAGSAAMGPQVDDTLTAVLQSVEDTDMGLLFESRTQFGLGYRTLTSMANQSAAAVINYNAAILDPSLAPAFDDSLTRNNVTVTNWTGYTQQAVLTTGPMSVLNPPAGVGNGYGYTRTVNAAADTQIPAIATWLLNVGSVDEVRFPVVTVKLARTRAAALFAALPGLRPGDYLQITSLPAFLTASTVKQLAVGYTETMGPREWTFAFNTIPESPYETGFSAGTVQTAQLPGSGAVTSTAPGAGGLGGILANGSVTPAMLNQGITVKTLGGTLTTISASPPAGPNTGDIWIASATGLISGWDGTAWVPYRFDASQAIQAGTIVAANIAASTITSGLIAAGTIVGGIVDATTITGASLVATGTSGDILVYSGTPAAGNLVGAWSGTAGTDTFGNAFTSDINAFNFTALQPGSNPTAVETWHTLGPIGNGWTTNHGRYRRTAENEIQLDISLTAGGSPTYGNITWPNTMPLAYRPIVTRRLAGVPSGGAACHSTINTTGAVSSNIPSPAGTFDCCGRVPLD